MRKKQLDKILRLSQHGLATYIRGEIKTMSRDGFLYHKGKIPILLVAHMDTVHKETPKKIEKKSGIWSSPQGIGGDDRCGVYMILQLLKKYDCHAVFLEDEEIGCIGAKKFADSKLAKRIKEKMMFAIEMDRRGSNDAVFYYCDNYDFTDFVTKEYFKEDWGTCSDICDICPALNCAGVNVSSGYYDEHTLKEAINTKEVDKIITEVGNLIERGIKENTYFEYVEAYRPQTIKFNGSKYFEDWGYYNYYGQQGKKEEKEEIYKYFVIFDESMKMVSEMVAKSKEEAIYDYLDYYAMDYGQTEDDLRIWEVKGGF